MEDSREKITLNFKLLTGGTFSVSVDSDISVDLLKKIASKKLKISKDRITLMSSERELQDGTLKDNGIVNGSKIIVAPNVETGLAQRTENTVMQALDSLNDNQVNDFLSGKSPLNLSVRLGDHMMLIQLQLSTLSPSQQNSLKQRISNSAALKQPAVSQPSTSEIFPSTSQKRPADHESTTSAKQTKIDNFQPDDHSKSPINSLNSMVTSQSTTVQNVKPRKNKFWSPSSDPIAANLTSCLCKRLNVYCKNNCEQPVEPNMHQPCSYTRSVTPPQPLPFHHRPSPQTVQRPSTSTVTSSSTSMTSDLHTEERLNTDGNSTENPALSEASRNLTQTLRKLSKRVFTNKTQTVETGASSSSSTSNPNLNSSELAPVAGSSGAIIESMKHHGKGIYSGTFSGTLNPALQDKNGRPKRDISTIIHILNDLLSATPQCKNGAKIFFEPTHSSSGPSGKFIKIKKHSSSKSSQSVPKILPHQKCTYGQCNGHLKTDSVAKNSNPIYPVPSTSASAMQSDPCVDCVVHRNQEIENMKTKNKLEKLKMVMNARKLNREARKLKVAPYNAHLNYGKQSFTTTPVPQLSPSNPSAESLVIPGKNQMSSSATATASTTTATTSIAASLSTNNAEMESHLEEVDSVA